MTSKAKAFIAKHKKTVIAATALVGLVAVTGTTALLSGREDLDGNTAAIGTYDIAKGDATTTMSAALFPGSSDSQTIEVVNSGVFGAVYGFEVETKDGATVDPSVYADIDVTLAGAVNWTGSFADLETLTVVDTTGIAPKAANATSGTTTLTLSVPAGEDNPAFGTEGSFEYTLSIVHNQNNGSGSPELLTGLTGAGETKTKPKA